MPIKLSSTSSYLHSLSNNRGQLDSVGQVISPTSLMRLRRTLSILVKSEIDVIGEHL